jgi:broad specificity phosphatase PhoE
MAVIYLVRHGQAHPAAYGASTYSKTGGLTDLGRAQAGAAGWALAERAPVVHAALSGTIARQRETADVALGSVPIPPFAECDERWNEYDFPSIVGGAAVTESGRSLQSIVDAALRAWVTGRALDDQSAETYTDYSARCAAALDDLAGRLKSGQTAAVFSSSGTIANVVSRIWGVDPLTWITMSRTMVNASLSKLIVGRRGVSVVSFNEHHHVETSRRLMTFR